MPATRAETKSIYLVGGDDEFSIKQTAAKLAEILAPKGAGEFGVEIIEGGADNQDEALSVFGRLQEGINAVGLFGGGKKLVWLKNTDLLADNQTTRTEAVKDALADLSDQLLRGLPEGVSLLISAIGCDKRRSVFKTLEKTATVQLFDAPEAGKEAGEEEITEFIQRKVAAERKNMGADALGAFRELVAPTFREMASELEKLCIYVGNRAEISPADVRAICSATRESIIWDLTDSLCARRLPHAIGTLENLLGAGEKPIGVVMMLVSQFRLMLLAKDLIERGLVRAPASHFDFMNALKRLPADALAHVPRTKEGQLPNAWRWGRCAVAAGNFSLKELISALDLLLEAHILLVSTQLDERLVLEETITKIARKPS